MTKDNELARRVAALFSSPRYSPLPERDLAKRLGLSSGQRGLLRSALDMTTMKPYPPGYFTDDMDIFRDPKADIGEYSELMEYENAGMVSGAYLCAMLLKHRATRDTEALDRAYRTFYGLKDVFERSQSVEPGYFCKPYGGKVTRETSNDQYIYVLT
ncbi:MAG: hypothetical protein EOM10_08900, partial [Opitutae bacterium]|nr:hypothetical protein [Opitutae bacterium]